MVLSTAMDTFNISSTLPDLTTIGSIEELVLSVLNRPTIEQLFGVKSIIDVIFVAISSLYII
jgi:hypothetical protein